VGLYASEKLPADLLDAFRTAGFYDNTYEDQNGVFLTKELTCGSMPMVKAKDINEWSITEDSICVIDLLPDGDLQMYIADDDYVERYDFATNKEGFLALAKDAGVNVTGVQ
jgi:hypothetical protein